MHAWGGGGAPCCPPRLSPPRPACLPARRPTPSTPNTPTPTPFASHPPPLPLLPQRPSHRNCTVGWCHRRDDLEIEPRYNMGTESLSAAVAYRVDDENKLRAIFDM